MSVAAELGSIASSMDAMGARLEELAGALAGGPDDGVAIAIVEIERQLSVARRRTERLLRELDPG